MRHAPIFPHESGRTPYWRGRAERLVPAERALMYWWLDNYGKTVLQVWYDVPLDGRPASMQVDAHAQSVLDPDWQRVWQRQRARRADAIVQDADGYRIIELRSSADAQTVGEMAIYQQLARAEHPGLTWLPSVLVARLLKPGVGEAIAALGAHIYVAPETLYDPAAIVSRYNPDHITV